MFTIPFGILLVVLVVFVVVPIVAIGCIRMFLSMLDESRRVPPHTLRRIH